jgi:hypothetical protein
MTGLERDETALIEHVVAKLKLLSRQKTLEYTLLVGRLIVETLYKGDIELVRSRGRKESSFRRLANHPELPFSAVSLWRCVATYHLVQTMPEVLAAEHLSATHVRVVLQLPVEQQRDLLNQAESQRWTSHQLEVAVRRTRTPAALGGREGRAAGRVMDRALRNLEGALAELGSRQALEPTQVEELQTRILGARRALAECEARLEQLRDRTV